MRSGIKKTANPSSLQAIWLAILLTILSFNHGWAQDQSDSYLHGRIPQTDKRYSTMKKSLDLLKERKAQVLVETGTARGGSDNFTGDGGSTIIFSDWARDNNAILYSIDINREYLEVAESAIGENSGQVVFVCSDSIEYLKSIDQPIDFLYLDSYDFKKHNPLPSQIHHLKEICAAYPHLHEESIVMIDDCDLPFGGKGKYVIDFLKKKGWVVVAEGYQVILVRESSLGF